MFNISTRNSTERSRAEQSRALHEKLIATHVVKKFPAFYGTRTSPIVLIPYIWWLVIFGTYPMSDFAYIIFTVCLYLP
jgi:hypothetical protein